MASHLTPSSPMLVSYRIPTHYISLLFILYLFLVGHVSATTGTGEPGPPSFLLVDQGFATVATGGATPTTASEDKFTKALRELPPDFDDTDAATMLGSCGSTPGGWCSRNCKDWRRTRPKEGGDDGKKSLTSMTISTLVRKLSRMFVRETTRRRNVKNVSTSTNVSRQTPQLLLKALRI